MFHLNQIFRSELQTMIGNSNIINIKYKSIVIHFVPSDMNMLQVLENVYGPRCGDVLNLYEKLGFCRNTTRPGTYTNLVYSHYSKASI